MFLVSNTVRYTFILFLYVIYLYFLGFFEPIFIEEMTLTVNLYIELVSNFLYQVFWVPTVKLYYFVISLLTNNIPMSSNVLVFIFSVFTFLLFITFLKETKERQLFFKNNILNQDGSIKNHSIIKSFLNLNKTRIIRYFLFYLPIYLYTPYSMSVPIIFFTYLIVCHCKFMGLVQTWLISNIFITFLYLLYPMYVDLSIDLLTYVTISYGISYFFFILIVNEKHMRNFIKLLAYLTLTFTIFNFLIISSDVFMSLNLVFTVYLMYFILLKISHKLSKNLKPKSIENTKNYKLLHFDIFKITILVILTILLMYHIMYLCGISSNNGFLIYSILVVKY